MSSLAYSIQALDNYKAFIVAQNEPLKRELETVGFSIQAETEGNLQCDVEDLQLKWQTSIRLRLLGHYLQYLKLAIQDGDVEWNMITIDSINRIIDSTLLGTSSERLQGKARIHYRFQTFTSILIASSTPSTSIPQLILWVLLLFYCLQST